MAHAVSTLASESATTLIIGSEENFPPFAVGNTDETADGYTIELWKEVAKETGLKYSIRVRPWGQILQEFKNGKVDVLINIAQSEERRQYTDFSVPHVTVNGAIFVRKGESRIRSEADLAGKSIIVFKSDLAHEYAVSNGWQKQLVIVSTPQEGITLLASGRHDAMLLSKLVGMQTLRELNIKNVKALDVTTGYSQKFSFGVHKGDSELLAKLNEGLALTKASGAYDDIYRKWFGIYEVTKPTVQDMLPYIAPIIIISLMIAGYNFRKRRIERKRAREALSASEENLRLILDSTGEAIYGIDLNGNCTFCNAACVKMLGYSRPDEILGKNMHCLIHHTRHDGTPLPVEECRIFKAFTSGQGSHVDDEVLWRSDGTSFAAEYRSFPQFKEGKSIGSVVTFTDITERKFKENAHQQSTQLLQLASTHSDLRQCMSELAVSLQNWSGCEAVGIRLRDGDDFPYFETRGFPSTFVQAENHLCAYGPDGAILRDGDGNPVLECMCGNILNGRFDTSKPFFTGHGSFWSNNTSALLADTTEADRQARTRNRCNGEGYESVALIPMHAGDQIIGLMQINDHHQGRFTPALIEIFEDMADKVALALTRRQAENELHKSEKLHRDLLDTIPDLIWLKDANGVYLSCNSTFERFFGAGEDDIKGKTDYDFVDKELADFFREHDRRATESGKPFSNEEWVTFADDGHRALLFTTKMPMYDNEGKLIGVLGVGRDITELKLALEQLDQSRELLVNLANQVPGVIYQYRLYADGRSAFPYSSPGMNDIYEVTPEEVQEDATPVFTRLHPDDYDNIASAIQESARTLRTFYCEFRVILPRQGLRWRWSQAQPERMPDGGTLWHGVILDITDRKLAEEERIKLESQLHQAQKMESVGSLAGGVAHDFNNKLSVILGCTYLAFTESDPFQQKNLLEEIRKAAEQSADLTRQLLAFARKQTIVPKVLDLNETVTGMLKMLNRLIGEDIQLTWRPATDLWLLMFDPSQIDQILANLCVNARDSITNGGNITIETSNSSIDVDYCAHNMDAVPGEYVRLVVSDNGCGMDKETLDRIFDPFFTTKETGKGTGLGLATVFGIVKQNNGFINVYSEPGIGTTFSVYLPRHVGTSMQTQQASKEMPASPGHETVLLVEDELAILNMTTMILANQGYTVLSANTTAEAIRLAKEHAGAINLLITDVIMPEMNGKDLADNLKTLNPQLRCLFMSGYTSDAIAHHGVLDEGVEFIQKPFSLPDFATKVRQVLDSK